jgi:hypothetical protein
MEKVHKEDWRPLRTNHEYFLYKRTKQVHI